MGWRSVIITHTAKLDYKMNYLVVRSGDSVQRINIDEIALCVLPEKGTLKVTF